MGESILAETLSDLAPHWPDDISIIKIRGHGYDWQQMKKGMDDVWWRLIVCGCVCNLTHQHVYFMPLFASKSSIGDE